MKHPALVFSLLLGLFVSPAAVHGDSSAAHSGGAAAASSSQPDHPAGGSSPHHPFTEPVIHIDAGHGGIDGGTSHGELLEKDINLAIACRLYTILRSQHFAVLLNRDGDYALSEDNHWHKSRSRHQKDLTQRERLTEELPTAMVISLHVNWSKNASRSGPVVLYQNEGRSVLLASAIQDSLNSLYGTNRLPVWGKPFYLLNQIEEPAVIVETGFISSSQDRERLTSPAFQTQIAEAIAGAVTFYLSAVQHEDPNPTHS
ncbi:N-acetylmuramoyl-L-alanine amidase [Paenibacillus sp. JX-17]|uniref:N-acetylmuramoyl-L-alanine amidase n=1 Tax=Paenibacillus lacisoli TaxID=3064525 RepID=A0ABT9C9P8_9BACL|nr:N-acetylmuramoyl-L-alanine amidase [Paenibacillus sp. JX-17]MDO7905976.1 N-acetylmuramoyl-L-alanine amidase [Paenibacillus sp. JX-17]